MQETRNTDPAALDAVLIALVGALCIAVLLPAVALLRFIWTSTEFYGHAYAVPVVVAYLMWRSRAQVLEGLRPLAPPTLGPLVLFGAASVEALLILGDIGFGAALGIPLVLGAAIWAVGGSALLRPLALPLLFLVLMVPPPAFLMDQMLVQLKFFVTTVSVSILQSFGAVVTAQGNQVLVPGRVLFVADACSGLTSIVTLLPLSAIVAFFLSHGIWRRLLVIASVVPLAIGANVVRVTATVLLVSRYGMDFAEGFLHESFGLATYVVGTLALIAVAKVLR